MPFNYSSSVLEAAKRVMNNPIKCYPDLDALLRKECVDNVLEMGCGAGWAANAIALHYGKDVTALDMTEKALVRAPEVSRRLDTVNRIRFIHADLFDFRSSKRFDLVLSIGVLHHTHDCRQAFNYISQFVAGNGFMFVGLYHLYGRRAFLAMFREILEKHGEEAAFFRHRKLNPGIGDETHLRSWFRDQVLHPHETHHTLDEVRDWLDNKRFTLLTTSINQYQEVGDRSALKDLEIRYDALSERRNIIDGDFFPGFFTVLFRRNE
jgi:SAM-dependent methyltransferase